MLEVSEVSKRESKFVLRYLLVGLSGTVLDFSLLSLLKWTGLPVLPANTLSFLAGVVNNYLGNRYWTFEGRGTAGWTRQLGQFLAVSLVGLACNNLIIYLLEDPMGHVLGQPQLGYLPAKVLATAFVVVWNYLANRYWTFRPVVEA
jgi:putative flippase GtrA